MRSGTQLEKRVKELDEELSKCRAEVVVANMRAEELTKELSSLKDAAEKEIKSWKEKASVALDERDVAHKEIEYLKKAAFNDDVVEAVSEAIVRRDTPSPSSDERKRG